MLELTVDISTTNNTSTAIQSVLQLNCLAPARFPFICPRANLSCPHPRCPIHVLPGAWCADRRVSEERNAPIPLLVPVLVLVKTAKNFRYRRACRSRLHAVGYCTCIAGFMDDVCLGTVLLVDKIKHTTCRQNPLNRFQTPVTPQRV